MILLPGAYHAFQLQFRSITSASLAIWLGLVILVLHADIASAYFSAFVVITPRNEAEHPFLIQASAVEDQPGFTRIRVIGPVDASRKAWLIKCEQSLLPDSQNFRSAIWEGRESHKAIIDINLLEPTSTGLQESDGQQRAYVEVLLSNEELKRSYVYIDYPYEVRDGGYYYSIDLAYYLHGPSARKSMIQWEKK